MTVTVLTVDPLTRPPDVDLRLPGSKSITNRALIVAALADDTSVLVNPLVADDTRAMEDCLRSLGAEISHDHATNSVTVKGTGGALRSGGELSVRQSGTTARFVIPLAAFVGDVTVDGHEQIRQRPQGDLFAALVDLGARIEPLHREDHLPVRFGPANLSGGRVSLPGDVSSQFISGLLLCAPLLPEGLTVELTGEIVSAPYIEMTVAVMRAFGAAVEVDDNRSFTVHAGGYSSRNYRIEPDASAASYFFAAAAVSEGRVAVEGLGSDSLQGDTRFVDVLGAMGAQVEMAPDRTEVRGTATLEGIEVSMRDISDTAPTLAAIAPFAAGPVSVTDIGFVRKKESDRIDAVVTELVRLGVEATDSGDGFTILPGMPVPGTVQTYDDHRMAMAFTILGLMVPGVAIADPQCVAKTFPEFFDTVDALRAVADAELAVLALDGPAGSGKSTVARLAAGRLGLEYLDTGAMYRIVTLAALDAGLDLADEAAVARVARHVEIDVGAAGVYVDGVDVSEAIREERVNQHVSQVAANPSVRAAMRRQQRAWARRRGGGVMEGRDIGTVVFPRARLKVYVTASLEERARRRADEAGASQSAMVASLRERDAKDSSRADSPLAEADDAVVLDTTGLTIDQVVDRVVDLFRERGEIA